MGILIKNGTIVTALDEIAGDLYCDGGTIAAVGGNLDQRKQAGDDVIDASGQFLFPGAIDPHTHFELPFMGTVSADDFESGTAAAIAGGTTTVIDFVIPAKGGGLIEALQGWHEKANKAVCDYAFHMALTDASERVLREIPVVVKEHGISTFKAFMAYKGAIGVDDESLIHFMQMVSAAHGLLWLHAENGDAILERQKRFIAEGKTGPEWHEPSRPAALEAEAVNRALTLAELYRVPIGFVHMSSRDAYQAFAAARVRGVEAYAETCPQYLVLDDSVTHKPDFEGATYIMSPPIRPAGHSEWLWRGLANGMINTTGTDHCPFRLKDQKEMGRGDFTKIPNGGPGVENRVQVLWHFGVNGGWFDKHRFVALTSTNAAKIYGMYPRKGALRVGSDADVVVWDPKASFTFSVKNQRSRCDRSMYEGITVQGAPSHVVAGGKVRLQNGELKVERGSGKYISRAARR
ncbi:MAG: dihydropyrimidinase [Deltaproteobacteria bacterium]|nr:dihydropyrimidinase [Deltaproteobacteria bacterium]